MARTLQFKRLANTQLSQTIGANGEIIIDYTNGLLTIHDGVTPGGNEVSTAQYTQLYVNQAIALASGNIANTFTANTGNLLVIGTNLTSTSINVGPTIKGNGNGSVIINSNNFIWSFNANGTLKFSDNTIQNTAFRQESVQNFQSNNYVLQSIDVNKYIYYTQASNTILYIPWSSNVGFSNGTTIMIVSKTSSSANVTISPNTGVSLYLAGNATSASRNVITYGVATLIQAEANTWFISGTGVV